MPSTWFKHDSNARNSKKIIRLRSKWGAAGYGVYFMLIERLREEEDFTSDLDYAMLAFDIRAEEEMIRSVVEDFSLFEISADGKRFTCHGIHERMEDNKSKSDAGRKGAQTRWNKNRDRIAQDSTFMANASFANGKPIADDIAKDDFANGNKIRKDKIRKEEEQKETSFSSSLVSSFSSYESLWAYRITAEFFFRNYAHPERECKRFISYNCCGGRDWDTMEDEQRAAALNLWKAQDDKCSRHDARFLTMWLRVVGALEGIPAPADILLSAISDNLSARVIGKYLVIFCNEALSEYLERNIDAISDAYKEGIADFKVKNIRYATPIEKTPADSLEDNGRAEETRSTEEQDI